jgi:hypothetical protein
MSLIIPFGMTVTPYGGGTSVTEIGEVIRRKQQEVLMRGFSQFLMLGMDSVGTQALVEGSQDFFTLALKGIQQQLLEVWNQQLIPLIFKYNPMPGLTDLPKITWHDPGKVDIKALLEAYKIGSDAKLITPVIEDEQFIRPIMGLPDLPAGEGLQSREEQPMVLEGLGGGMGGAEQLQMSASHNFHLLGQHDQSTHGHDSAGAGIERGPALDYAKDKEKAQEWFADTHYEFFAKKELTEADRSVARDYVTHRYKPLNDTLRGKRMPDKYHYDEVGSMDKMINSWSAPDDVIVYRGGDSTVWESLEVGDTLEDKGYTSTSVSPEHAKAFSASNRSKKYLQIRVPKGSHAVPASSIEQELVLPRGSKFLVTGEHTDGQYVVVEAEVTE